MNFNRRTLFSALGAGFALSACRTLAPTSASETAGTENAVQTVARPRWEPGVDADYKKQYIEAVRWLKANDDQSFPEGDPRSYLSWKKLLTLHQMSCQHSNWFLLPWHRLYLNYFEAACQVALNDPNFALPYWDWTQHPEVPAEFYSEDVLKQKRDLAEGQAIPPELVGDAVIKKLLASDDFFNFHSYPPAGFPFGTPQIGNFEGTPHNGVHNTVGGIMGSTTDSPTDPIFWLHHCNIDRLWDIWLKTHPNVVEPFLNPTEEMKRQGADWGGTQLSLEMQDWVPIIPPQKPAPDIKASPAGRSATALARPRDLVLVEALGYRYAGAEAPAAIQTARLPRESKQRAYRVLEGKTMVENGLLRTQFSFQATAEQKIIEFLRDTQGRSAGTKPRISLSVIGLTTPEDARLRSLMLLRVFVSEGKVKEPEAAWHEPKAFEDPAYIGSHSPFVPAGHSHGDHKKAQVGGVSFDVTEAAINILLNKKAKDLSAFALVYAPGVTEGEVNLLSGEGTRMRLQFSF